MSGITGFYSKSQKSFVSREELEEITLAMSHRGPDAEGIYYTPIAGFGHRLLNILDSSNAANQPMESHCMRYICVYNGEVYNYRQIAKELNIKLKTNSDTEIIVEAFAEWGPTFINKLNGMFSICIYDKQEHILYLFRDRLGIKPLYYYWDGVNFAFSSELRTLLGIKHIRDNRAINIVAINEFLHLGYISEPNTIYSNIHKFPSGHIGIASENGFRTESYWNIEGCIKSSVISEFSEAKEKLKELVESSVAMRLMSNVPFGTFLSGGVDSSLVTAIASRLITTPIKTFSLGFEDSDYDELQYANSIASYLGTEHNQYIATKSDVKEAIVDILDFYDEPFADSSAIPLVILSKKSKEKVSMMLSGDGGNELFLGSESYVLAKKTKYFPNSKVMKNIFGLMFGKKSSEIFQLKNSAHIKSHIFSQYNHLFGESEFDELLNPELIFNNNLEQDYTNFRRKLTFEEEQAIFDIRYYLKDNLLVKTDRISMKHALEVRVPLLDHRIVEFALNVDPKLKMSSQTQKYLLKQLLFEYIPASYFDRLKHPYIPLKKWLKGDLSYLIDKYLNESVINRFKIINIDEVQRLIAKFDLGYDYLYNRIWALIVLHKFLIKDSI